MSSRESNSQLELESSAVTNGGLTRREWLIGLGALGIGSICAWAIFGDHGLPQPGSSAYDSRERIHYTDRLSKLIADGLEKDWNSVAVFPGLLIASPGARFYKDVGLREEADVGLKPGNRELILRPVFPGESLLIGTGVDYSDEDLEAVNGGGIDSDTYAFFSPEAGGVAFGNYSQSINHMEVATRLQYSTAFSAQTTSSFPLQFIDVVERQTAEGVVIPAGLSSSSREYIDDGSEPGINAGYNLHQSFFAMAQGRLYGQDEAERVVEAFKSAAGVPVTLEPNITFIPPEE